MTTFVGLPWRFIFTDLATETTTWAEGLLTNRKYTETLDQSSVIEADVFPDDKRVNLLYKDGYPLVAQSNRLIYGFRREGAAGSDGTPWVCRAAGLLMQPEDQADADVPISHLSAWDPWQYLGARPCVDSAGNLPGTQGLQSYFLGDTGDQIVLNLLKNTISAEASSTAPIGNGTFIDAGPDWGGTAFYGGTLESTPEIVINFQQGTSVADAWTQLCNAGNLDIVLRPIYDPINRPGYTHELNIYNLAGVEQPSAIFAWDMLTRNLKNIDRLHDATPGNFFNKGLYYSGQGGIPIPSSGPLENGDSITAFGTWWSQQFFPNQTQTVDLGSATYSLLVQSLVLAKQGKRTLTMDPIPERSPRPFIDYFIGDRVPVYASKALRVTSAGLQRVQAIPVEISDDGIENIASLLTSPDFRSAS